MTRLLPMQRLSAEQARASALPDLFDGLKRHEAWRQFAFNDLRMRFRRSVFGPLWLTFSMAIMIGTMASVFSTLFQQDITRTMPYIATGLIFWNLLTSCITEGSSAFVDNAAFIRNVQAPLSVHIYRVIARNVMIFCFNIVIYIAVIVAFGINPGLSALWFVPGAVLFMINAAWIALVACILSTRYRDIPQIIANVMQVLFFLTPIFWSPESLPQRPAFVHFNPVFHLIELVRAPLLGAEISTETWIVCLAMAVIGSLIAALLYRRAYARIAYWV